MFQNITSVSHCWNIKLKFVWIVNGSVVYNPLFIMNLPLFNKNQVSESKVLFIIKNGKNISVNIVITLNTFDFKMILLSTISLLFLSFIFNMTDTKLKMNKYM